MLFHGNPLLIQGFNTFLPKAYRIDVSADPLDPITIKVTTPMGTPMGTMTKLRSLYPELSRRARFRPSRNATVRSTFSASIRERFSPNGSPCVPSSRSTRIRCHVLSWISQPIDNGRSAFHGQSKQQASRRTANQPNLTMPSST